MSPIVIPFNPSKLGRVRFFADVSTGNRKSLKSIQFKLDTGSDFTTLSCKDLGILGYTREFLESRPFHENDAVFGDNVTTSPIRYIRDVSIKFDDRELQGCRIFFALDTELQSFFGSDLLKYFNIEINNDAHELRLTTCVNKPSLASGETPIHIYSLS